MPALTLEPRSSGSNSRATMTASARKGLSLADRSPVKSWNLGTTLIGSASDNDFQGVRPGMGGQRHRFRSLGQTKFVGHELAHVQFPGKDYARNFFLERN